MMHASPSPYLHQGQPFDLSQDYLSGFQPLQDTNVRLRRKVKRKRERTYLTGSNQPDSSEEESDYESVAYSSNEDLKQRSRSTSSEHQQSSFVFVHNDENSNSSQSSHDSTTTKATRRRRRHKILVTEEKMADALRELHLDLNMFDAARLHSLLQQRHEPVISELEMTDSSNVIHKSADISFVDFEDDDENNEQEDTEATESTLVLSDELKETLKLFDEQRAKEIKKFLATVQLSKRNENLSASDPKMQLVPYKKSPVITVLTESSSSTIGNMEPSESMSNDNPPMKHFKANRSILNTQNPNTFDSDSNKVPPLSSSSSSSSSLFAPGSPGMFETVRACPYRVEEPIEKYLEKQSLKR